VIILLNAAVIPDSVIRQIKNFERGWQKDFYELMEDYKRNTFRGQNFEF
jgi:hypothetical protein